MLSFCCSPLFDCSWLICPSVRYSGATSTNFGEENYTPSPPPLQIAGLEFATFRSRVRRFTNTLSRLPFCADSHSVYVPPRVTAVARKRPRPFRKKCKWQVTPKHAYTLDTTNSERADSRTRTNDVDRDWRGSWE